MAAQAAAAPAPAGGRHGARELWGFDPLDLLAGIEFPSDRHELDIMRSRPARIRALRKQTVAAVEAPVKQPEPATTPAAPAAETEQNDESAFMAASEVNPDHFDMDEFQEHLARVAAAVLIQAVWNGWNTRRKYLIVTWGQLSGDRLSRKTIFNLAELPSVNNLTTQESLVAKYERYCDIFDRREEPLPTFPHFCAAKVQSIWRRFLMKKVYESFKNAGNPELNENAGSDADIAEKIRFHIRAQKVEKKVRVIQRVWRRYKFRKTFEFFKNLISFGDSPVEPKRLLKFINPTESELLELSAGMHVRFRLGGETFPPKVYYKIFVHRALIDFNAFAPRDYTSNDSKTLLPRFRFLRVPDYEPPEEHLGWYKRIENNGWRPVAHKIWEKLDDGVTAPKPVVFHHSKLVRRDALERARRERKLAWFKKLYAQHRDHDAVEDRGDGDEERAGPVVVPGGEKHGEDIPEEALLGWSDRLDFDAYIQDWVGLAMSSVDGVVT